MHTNKLLYGVIMMLAITMQSCHHETEQEAGPAGNAIVPVTVTAISTEPLSDYIELNATSAFMQSNYIKSNARAYVSSIKVKLGDHVNAGDQVFVLKTKEADAIGNAVTYLDSTLRFSGIININSSHSGYITQINHQSGDYVQDGDQLAVINDMSSFVFLMNLPYELNSFAPNGKTVEITLPGGEKLQGTISQRLTSVDSATQTQNVVLKVTTNRLIPENLVSKVRIVKTTKSNTVSLPKAAILADETQSNFWVMLMTDSNTAVKVPIIKGLETKERVEIISPKFNATDKILLTGNYGLPDTAKVQITK